MPVSPSECQVPLTTTSGWLSHVQTVQSRVFLPYRYFAERDATVAQQVLSDSVHPKCRYLFKIEVGFKLFGLVNVISHMDL